MRLVIIGSGTAVPQARRSAPGCLILSDRGKVIVDLGPGTIWGAQRHAGVSARELDVVLLSHFHMDHCSDLAPLLFALRSPFLTRNKPLRILGPPGLSAHFRALEQVWEHRTRPEGYELEIVEVDGVRTGAVFELGEVAFRAAPTKHSLFNLAWRLDGPGGNGVLFTGDGEGTAEFEALARLAPHILVSECSAAPGEILPGHLNPEQAGELAARCGSTLLVLTHINPGVEPQELVTAARREYGGEVVVAEDGMVIEVSDKRELNIDAGTRGRGDAEKG